MQMGTLDMDTIRFGGRVYSVCFVVVGVPGADGHAGHGHHKVLGAVCFVVGVPGADGTLDMDTIRFGGRIFCVFCLL